MTKGREVGRRSEARRLVGKGGAEEERGVTTERA
jgi:hypothetical protein